MHKVSKTDEAKLPLATKLIDAACLLSQSVYKINVLRVSLNVKMETCVDCSGMHFTGLWYLKST